MHHHPHARNQNQTCIFPLLSVTAYYKWVLNNGKIFLFISKLHWLRAWVLKIRSMYCSLFSWHNNHEGNITIWAFLVCVEPCLWLLCLGVNSNPFIKNFFLLSKDFIHDIHDSSARPPHYNKETTSNYHYDKKYTLKFSWWCRKEYENSAKDWKGQPCCTKQLINNQGWYLCKTFKASNQKLRTVM